MQFTLEEIAKHSSINDFWCVLHGKVYDLTSYIEYHPGGPDALVPYAGKDISSEFGKFQAILLFLKFFIDFNHSWVNYEMLLDTCLRGFLIF